MHFTTELLNFMVRGDINFKLEDLFSFIAKFLKYDLELTR